jgi:hypothetical protein
MTASVVRRTLALFCVIIMGSANPTLAAAPSGEDAGSVVIVDPLNSEREYQRGDSTSAFTLRLPEGAACPGDSANDGWRVQSFIVPVGTDLAALVFAASRPDVGDPASSRSLREINDAIYTQRMTEPNQTTGAPGLILPLPPLTFAHFDTGTFPPGRYQIGVACTTPDWKVRRYWHAEIEFVPAPDVEPGGLRWTFLGDGEVIAGADDDFPVPAAGLAGVIGISAVIVGGVVLRRRRMPVAGSSLSQSQEDFA